MPEMPVFRRISACVLTAWLMGTGLALAQAVAPPVTYRLTEDNELRDASISGPFYPGVADVTYDISVTTSSEPVSITLPE